MILEGKTLGELRKPKELGRKGTNKFIWAACKKCGKERWVLYRYHILRNGNVLCRGCSIKNIQPWLVHEIGPKHWHWNGGKYLTKGKYKGYVNIWIDPSDQYYCMKDRRGDVLEHRLIMAQHIGRPLQKNEWIHHKNGIKTDNRIENLELIFNG